jgi:hypothetical protein
VMAEGRLVMEGEPRTVFAREEEIRSLGLDVPEMARLAGILRKAGMDIAEGIMNVSEMEVELCRLK